MNQVFGGAFLIGIVAAMWNKIKEVSKRITSLFVVTCHAHDTVCTALIIYARMKMKRSRFGSLTYSGISRYVKPLERHAPVTYETLSSDELVVFWKDGRPITITLKGIGQTQAIQMRFIRGTFNLDKLLTEATQLYRELLSEDRQADKASQRRSFVQRFVGEGRKMMDLNVGSEPTKGITQQYTGHSHTTIFDAQVRFLEYEPKDLVPSMTKSKYALDTLAFPEEITGLVDELKHWKDSEKWYKERDIQWRRGWLLHGPPGNGKTSLVRALAQDMNMPVFTFDLGSMGNKEFVKFWSLMMPYAPAIALLEDVDAVFHGRTNVLGEQGGGLTFDCLLNMLGGIDNNNGIFTVLTTNNPDLLDPALGSPRDDNMSSRPGRVDRAIFLGNPDFDCRKRIILKILRDMEDPDLSDLADECDGMSSAQVQERCMEIALNQLWRVGKALPKTNGHTSNPLAFIK